LRHYYFLFSPQIIFLVKVFLIPKYLFLFYLYFIFLLFYFYFLVFPRPKKTPENFNPWPDSVFEYFEGDIYIYIHTDTWHLFSRDGSSFSYMGHLFHRFLESKKKCQKCQKVSKSRKKRKKGQKHQKRGQKVSKPLRNSWGVKISHTKR